MVADTKAALDTIVELNERIKIYFQSIRTILNLIIT